MKTGEKPFFSFLMLLRKEAVLSYFYFINVLAHSMEEYRTYFAVEIF